MDFDAVRYSEIRVLVVDDDPVMLETLKRLVERIGLPVDVAASGSEAVEMFRQNNYLIVVSDIVMPEMDGIELLTKVKELSPPTRFIMMTGYMKMENILKCLRRGADSCVIKESKNFDKMEKALRRSAEMIQEWRDLLVDLNKMRQ
jgi:CheY-like chemotaxis protein